MSRNRILQMLGVLFALTVFVAACGDDDDADTAAAAPAAEDSSDDTADDSGGDTTDDTTEDTEASADSASICDPEGLVNAVESGPDEGTLDGMTDDPVGTAASSNPVLTTLVTAVSEAGLVDTLNDAEALTVFAPTDCAFSNVPQETLDAALADPEGLLTDVLGFHVVAGERLSAEDLAGMSELETFTGEILEIDAEGDTVTVGGGQANVQVPDIQTANATVHLIDAVMLPPSAQ